MSAKKIKLLTLGEAAEALDVVERDLRRMVADGDVRCCRVGGRLVFTTQQLEEASEFLADSVEAAADDESTDVEMDSDPDDDAADDRPTEDE